eukprot:1461088-Prymnesium_polylepis.1
MRRRHEGVPQDLLRAGSAAVSLTSRDEREAPGLSCTETLTSSPNWPLGSSTPYAAAICTAACSYSTRSTSAE